MIEVAPIKNAAHSANLCRSDLNRTTTSSLMKSRTDANDARTKRLLKRISVRGLHLIHKNPGKVSKTNAGNSTDGLNVWRTGKGH